MSPYVARFDAGRAYADVSPATLMEHELVLRDTFDEGDEGISVSFESHPTVYMLEKRNHDFRNIREILECSEGRRLAVILDWKRLSLEGVKRLD